MAVEAVPVVAAPRRASKRMPAGERWKRRGPLLPALVVAIVITQLPFLLTLYYSVHSQNLLRPGAAQFVGLANYGKVFTDELFRNALLNTVVLTASAVVLSMVLGIAFAVLLDKKFLGRGVVRTLLITPFLVMPAATALLWKTSLYNPVYGLLNWALSPFGAGNTDWVSEHPMISIVLVITWQWTPFMMLIVLAGRGAARHPQSVGRVRPGGAQRLLAPAGPAGRSAGRPR